MRIQARKLIDYAAFIRDHVSDLKGREVLIVGDVGLDEYVLGQVRRISPEAPVPIVEVQREESRLGLSANVAQNVASLGGVPRLVSVVGRDAAAGQLRKLLQDAGTNPESLIEDVGRPTTRKLRVIAQNHHIVRVDHEHRQFLSEEVQSRLLQEVAKHMEKASIVIIQDYSKGVVSESLVTEVVRLAHAHGKKVMVDPHRDTPLATYRGVDFFKPNFDESLILTGMPMNDLHGDLNHLNLVGKKIMQTLGCSDLVITRGKDGMRLFNNKADTVVDLPTNAKEVFDVTGAGDTVIAALALGWGAGFSLEEACALANFAAGVVVAHVGCVPCTVSELLEALDSLDSLEAEA